MTSRAEPDLDLLRLRFFRDITDNQREMIFLSLGLPEKAVDEAMSSHNWQRKLFDLLLDQGHAIAISLAVTVLEHEKLRSIGKDVMAELDAENDCPFDRRLARTPYLVLPKLALQVMPAIWRARFDAMLQEMEAAGLATPAYHVFRDDGPGETYTCASVVNESTGFVRLVKGQPDPWADYRHDQLRKVKALCPNFEAPQ